MSEGRSESAGGSTDEGLSPAALLESVSVWNGGEAVDPVVQLRLSVLRQLAGDGAGRSPTPAEYESAAVALRLSVSSVYRLLALYRVEGVSGLGRRERSDVGERKWSGEWEEFIVETYRLGNRGSRRLSRAQVSRLVESRAQELGLSEYPSRRSVYRILASDIKAAEERGNRHRLGWSGDELKIRTKAGIELEITHSNQVWQCDHTPADILVVGADGAYHRPCLTIVVDTYSRCIVGFHIGLDYPSVLVTCLALRHGMLAKRYSDRYELECQWGSYGVPQYLYTDAGSDFTSEHLEGVANSLGIVLCLRRKPSDGGIVERALGTINREFFATLPGYTTPRLQADRVAAEGDACLSLAEVERRLVRYIVDHYNQQVDARTGQESRMSRWTSGSMAMGLPPEERTLDVLLMRQDERRVYQGGYVRFANLVYRGEYLAGYAGQKVVLRYDPRDITTLYVYRAEGGYDVLLSRAHAMNLETERLSLVDAKAIARHLRQARKEINNTSILHEVRDRLAFVKRVVEQKAAAVASAKAAAVCSAPSRSIDDSPVSLEDEPSPHQPSPTEAESNRAVESSEEAIADLRSLPDIRVYDTEQLRQNYGL